MDLDPYRQSEAEGLELASRLNPSQLAAATYEGGPLLIVAGAGSGKTRTLVHRVAHLVDKGVPPPAIVLLTFTRKAAQEMLSRAAALVGRRAAEVSGGTFHSLANSLIRPYAHLLGYPHGFSIMDQDDSESLIGRIRSELPQAKRDRRFPQKGSLQAMLSQALNKDKPLAELMAESFPHLLPYAQAVAEIGRLYKEHKLANALMDFDDLLWGLESIMRDHEDIRRSLAGRYDYILVDEYQDTNPIQARLTHLLGRDHGRVTAVGDDAQSIYAFRGASFRNIMDFPALFPGARVLKLEDNYRSRQPIVSLANHLIAQAREKYDKTLRAVRGAGESPKLVPVQDLRDEAGWVAARVERFLDEGLELSDMAVLFRAASHSFDLEVELVRRRIPFTKYGGRKFLESAHIKDFLSFLRLWANPSDTLSLRRLLMLLEGVGLKGAEEIGLWVGGQLERLLELEQAPARGKAKKSLTALAGLIRSFQTAEQSPAVLGQLVYDFYRPLLRDLYPDDWPEREADLRELMRMAESRQRLGLFLDELTLEPPNQRRVNPRENAAEGLTLSTIHSAKGLEWKVVFILSAVEGRFPSTFAVRSAAEVEEERRLLYVAVTRAEDQLFILLPLGLADSYGGASAFPSRFLQQLPESAQRDMWPDNEAGALNKFNKWLNIGPEMGYNYPNKPALGSSPSRYGGSAPAPRPPAEPISLAPGQRVSHPIYGPGTVAELKESQAVIDFDHFGRKTVVVQYARLSSL